MMPGVTNLPVASMISAPAGIATFAPTAAILPSRSTIVPFGIVPVGDGQHRAAAQRDDAGLRRGRGLPGDASAGGRQQNEHGGKRQEPRGQVSADHEDLQMKAQEYRDGPASNKHRIVGFAIGPARKRRADYRWQFGQ